MATHPPHGVAHAHGRGRVHVIQPGFNSSGETGTLQALEETPTTLDSFDAETRALLERGEPFTLELGEGFETADVRAGFVAAPCAGMVRLSQLRFLQERGLRAIRMQRLHGTLAQNARALGIEIEITGES